MVQTILCHPEPQVAKRLAIGRCRNYSCHLKIVSNFMVAADYNELIDFCTRCSDGLRELSQHVPSRSLHLAEAA